MAVLTAGIEYRDLRLEQSYFFRILSTMIFLRVVHQRLRLRQGVDGLHRLPDRS